MHSIRKTAQNKNIWDYNSVEFDVLLRTSKVLKTVEDFYIKRNIVKAVTTESRSHLHINVVPL